MDKINDDMDKKQSYKPKNFGRLIPKKLPFGANFRNFFIFKVLNWAY